MPDEFDEWASRLTKKADAPDEFDQWAAKLSKPALDTRTMATPESLGEVDRYIQNRSPSQAAVDAESRRIEAGPTKEERYAAALKQVIDTGGGDARVDQMLRGIGFKNANVALPGINLRPRDVPLPFQDTAQAIRRGITGEKSPAQSLKAAQAAWDRNDKNITDDQLYQLAIQEYEQNRSKEIGRLGRIAQGVAQAPAIVAEAMVGGAAVKAAGKGLGLAKVVDGAKTPLGMGLQSAGVQAAATPITPGLWLKEAEQRQAKNGGLLLDPKNAGLPMFRAAFTNAIMGHLGVATKGKGVVRGLGVQAAAIPAEQALADVAGGAAEDAFVKLGMPEKMKTETGYGTFGMLASGKYGEAIEKVAVEAILSTIVSRMQGRKTDQVALAKDAFDSLAKDGVPVEKAPEILNLALSDPQKAPEGPVRDFAEAMKLPEPVKEAPKTPPEAANPESAKPAVEPEIVPETKPQEPEARPAPVESVDDVIARIMGEGDRRKSAGAGPDGVDRRQNLTLGRETPVTKSNVRASEVGDFDSGRFGENHFRVEILNDVGKPIGQIRVGLEGDTIHLPTGGQDNLRFGEGRGKGNQPFKEAELLKLATQLAERFPNAKKIQYKRAPERRATNPEFSTGELRKEDVTIPLARFRKAEPVKPGIGKAAFDEAAVRKLYPEFEKIIEVVGQVRPSQLPVIEAARKQGTNAFINALEFAEQFAPKPKSPEPPPAPVKAKKGIGKKQPAPPPKPPEPVRVSEDQARPNVDLEDFMNAPSEPKAAEKGFVRPDNPELDELMGFGRPLSAEEKAVGEVRGASGEGDVPADPLLRETALANAKMDAERVKNGLPPMMEAARKANADVWDRAMIELGKDANASAHLVDELTKKTRATTVEENALLLHRKIALNNEYERAMRTAIDAMMKRNPAEFDRLSNRADEILGQIDKLDKVTKTTGTEWGRAGQFRKQLAAEDYSLGRMMNEATRQKKAPLTPEEQQKVVELHDRIAELEGRLKDFENQPEPMPQEPQRSMLGKISDWLGSIFSRKPKAEPQIKSKLWDFADKMERDAAKELMQKFGPGKLFSGFDPTAIAPLAKYTAAKIIKSGLTFADFTKQIVGRFGDDVKPHVQEIWDKAQKQVSLGKMDATDVRIDLKSKKTEYQEIVDNFKRKNRPVVQKLWDATKETNNALRAIKTAYDLSAVFRQGALLSVGNASKVPAAVSDMIWGMLNPRTFQRNQDAIQQRPNAKKGYDQAADLYFSENEGPLNRQEEAFMGRLVGKIPGVAASQRAFSGYLNKLRADVFDAEVANLVRDGVPTKPELQKIGDLVNSFTGRGRFKGQADVALTKLADYFFSPRYLLSRLQVLSGQPFFGGTARTKKIVAKQYAKSALGLGILYMTAKAMLGDDVGITFDPRSADFGKFKIGNQRIDPLAGFAQLGTFGARMIWGESKDDKGKVSALRGKDHKFGAWDNGDALLQFVRNKAAPLPGEALDFLLPKYKPSGKGILQSVGQDNGVKPDSLADKSLKMGDKVVPISVNDVYDAIREQGVTKGTALSILAILGMGSQVYDRK